MAGIAGHVWSFGELFEALLGPLATGYPSMKVGDECRTGRLVAATAHDPDTCGFLPRCRHSRGRKKVDNTSVREIVGPNAKLGKFF